MKKSYYPSGDPEQCKMSWREHIIRTDGPCVAKIECHKKALFEVTTGRGQGRNKLRLCHDCFEDYIGTHDVELENIIRLSDDERDFERVDSSTCVRQSRKESRRASVATV